MAFGNIGFKKGSRCSPCPNKWLEWRPLAGLAGFLTIWPHLGLVSFQKGMENSGRNRVAENSPWEAGLETRNPGSPSCNLPSIPGCRA